VPNKSSCSIFSHLPEVFAVAVAVAVVVVVLVVPSHSRHTGSDSAYFTTRLRLHSIIFSRIRVSRSRRYCLCRRVSRRKKGKKVGEGRRRMEGRIARGSSARTKEAEASFFSSSRPPISEVCIWNEILEGRSFRSGSKNCLKAWLVFRSFRDSLDRNHRCSRDGISFNITTRSFIECPSNSSYHL
jgi:hypothetical protein